MNWMLAAALVFMLLGTVAAPIDDRRRVRYRERAEGVLPPLVALLDAWDAEGTHDVMVAPDGGLRTDEARQAGYASSGTSNAATLEDTPHGRGAALDVYPVSFLPYISGRWEDVPGPVKLEFATFGRFAEARGLKWGGRWSSSRFPNGDQPHVELPNWRSYPYPPEVA